MPWVISLRKFIINNTEAFLFLFASLIFQFFRQSVHVDEARYLSSAYEMYHSGNYLIPHLNGLPYSHKPPLLLWITCLLWKIFGVGEFIARFIPIFSTLITSVFIRKLASRQTQQIFLATGFVFVWSQFYMFDCLMMVWVTLGWYALFKNQQGVLSLAVTLGLLTKGPVVFIYLIPAAFFLKRPLILGFLGGVIVPLLWLAVAIVYGGDSYREALLWKQTAGRIINSFHHQRGWWFYGSMLPIVLLPWVVLPRFWQKSLGSDEHKAILKATLTSLLCFQLISCKQIHYLLPMIPMLMLVISEHLKGISLQRIVAVSGVIYSFVLISGEFLIQKRYPLYKVSHVVGSTEPVTLVTHRYRGEFGFLLRQPKLKVMSEEEYQQTPQKGQLIIYTESPHLYPKAAAVFEQKAGHYLLVVIPESTPVLNNVS